jgi:hypothetical protein
MTDNISFCPDCQIKYEKREEFRAIMNKLETINNLDHFDGFYMSGYSYAEMERFSLIFRKLQKRFHFPIELKDFVHDHGKKEAANLFETKYSKFEIIQKLENDGYKKIQKQIEDHEEIKDIDSLMSEIQGIISKTLFKEDK